MLCIQLYLICWPASKAVGVEFVGMKDMDGTFNTEMVELTGHLQSQEVILHGQR